MPPPLSRIVRPAFAGLLLASASPGFALPSAAAVPARTEERADVARPSFFRERLDALDPASPEIAAILDRARTLAAAPLLRRAHRLDHMGDQADGRRADSRAKGESVRARLGEEDALRFALASGDMAASRMALDELPLLAAAWRLTREPALLARLEEQLREIATWKPFQRPGWSLPHRKSPLPPEGDGVWLATGTLIQALALTLELLPAAALPSSLDAAVRSRIAEEIELTRSDWTAGVPWYVNGDKANSNQWVVPASGLVIGAAVLGRDRHAAAYQLGVESLRKSLALAGEDGSLNEGHVYGMSWTSFSLLLSARFMADAGDSSFTEAPFFRNFPGWAALLFQPGGNLVNAFDGFGSQRGSARLALTDLTRVAAVSGGASLARLVERECGGLRRDFFGLLARGLLASDPSDALPATSGRFERSRLFVWRSSWENDASGLWIRGGDADDFHDHHDRGHVSFTVAGVPVLIEAGTPGYANPRKRPEYDSAIGHNTLVLDGDAFPKKAPADIRVDRQDASGGLARLDLGRVYPEAGSVLREVEWTLRQLAVRDVIEAGSGRAVTPAWRWHFASAMKPEIERVEATRWRVRLPAGRLVFPAWIGPWNDPDFEKPGAPDELATAAVEFEVAATAPIRVTSETRPDHTLKFRRQENSHTVLVVTAESPVAELRVETLVLVLP